MKSTGSGNMKDSDEEEKHSRVSPISWNNPERQIKAVVFTELFRSIVGEWVWMRTSEWNIIGAVPVATGITFKVLLSIDKISLRYSIFQKIHWRKQILHILFKLKGPTTLHFLLNLRSKRKSQDIMNHPTN